MATRKRRRQIKVLGPIEARVSEYGPRDRNPRQKYVPVPAEWEKGSWVKVERIDRPTFPNPPMDNQEEESTGGVE